MYKDIVVCIDENDGRESTIRAAARLARDNDANLIGLYVRSRHLPALGSYGYISDEIAKNIKNREDGHEANAKECFDSITKELGADANWHSVDEDKHPLKVIAYSDLVITDHVAYDPLQGRSNMNFVNTLILDTGKPVVLIPDGWSEQSFGSNIVLGWDESREATRAMQDAMPLLQKANHVDAICVNCKGEDEVANAAQISTYLTRRKVNNSFKLAETEGRLDTAEKVLHDHAQKTSADLIVVGGYGHTRMREIVLGGVTRYLSKHSTVPVLFSH
jgi:hypothetical protein